MKHLYATYLDTEKSTFTAREINSLIIRVYQIVYSFLQNKTHLNNFTKRQIETEAIDLTAKFCMKNGKGIPVILEQMEMHSDKIESLGDFEFWVWRVVRNLRNDFDS